jgi:hypothetical protein
VVVVRDVVAALVVDREDAVAAGADEAGMVAPVVDDGVVDGPDRRATTFCESDVTRAPAAQKASPAPTAPTAPIVTKNGRLPRRPILIMRETIHLCGSQSQIPPWPGEMT